MKLNIIHEVPKELYECDVKDVHGVLGGPTLIHLKGQKSKALFLSTLLHGNETTSFLVLQKLINNYKDKELPRDMIIFIGNTLGASEGLRHLPGQPDYNRIWKNGDTPENSLATEVFVYAKQFDLFANIDLHNNTGKNPFYGCINVISDNYVELASMFSEQVVYFTEPSEVQSMAFAELCPSVTIEAGLPGNPEGTIAVYEFVQDVLHLDNFTDSFDHGHVEVYHTIGRIKVSKEATVDFEYSEESKSDLSFVPEIDSKNFELLKKNTSLGYINNKEMIYVLNNAGDLITKDILDIEGPKVKTNRMLIPSMFTKDIYVMKEDCLGYIMEKMIPIAN